MKTYLEKLFLSGVLMCFTSLWAQVQNANQIPFNGVVIDAAGSPVKGARVFVVNKDYAAKSDKQGRFGLTNVAPTDTLHVLFKKKQYDIPVQGRRSIRIFLSDQKVDSQEDSELVDIGYGYVKRREVLTPRSGISGEVLRRTGRTNVIAALDGLVPGLQVRPGGSVIIRGINSLNLSTDPLFIVDGVEVSSLDIVSVYDVDYVEVLKDGSIYGVKGANGAILVHTKK